MGIDLQRARDKARVGVRSSGPVLSASSAIPASLGASATVSGLPDLRAALAGLVPKLRRRALGNALRAGARVIRDDAKLRAPVLSASLPYRNSGTVRDAIKVRTSKIARKAGDVGVFVNVKPAKGAAKGAKKATDPFYWRWLEFGKQGYAGRGFLQGAASKLPQALEVFKAKIGPAIAKLNKPKAPAP